VEQAVLISIELSDSAIGSEEERQALGALGDDLAEIVASNRAGEFDGDEVGGGIFKLFFYGPSADKIFALIQPLLVELDWPGQIAFVKRYGTPGTVEKYEIIEGRDLESER
jgi:hypothetical protein